MVLVAFFSENENWEAKIISTTNKNHIANILSVKIIKTIFTISVQIYKSHNKQG